MIPYDDLVAALSQWRARKGLPVSTMGGGAPVHAASQSPSGPAPAAAVGKSPSGPKSAPPPARSKGHSVPPPLAPVETVEDIDSGAVLDDSAYEGDVADYALNFGGGGGDGDSTAIGGPPVRDSYATDPVGAAPNKRGGSGPTGKKRNDEW